MIGNEYFRALLDLKVTHKFNDLKGIIFYLKKYLNT